MGLNLVVELRLQSWETGGQGLTALGSPSHMGPLQVLGVASCRRPEREAWQAEGQVGHQPLQVGQERTLQSNKGQEGP